MAELKELTVSILSTTSAVDMKTVQKNNLFTVPTGKTAYIVMVVIREPSATLTGGTDYDLGTGAAADTWRQTVDLLSMTTADTDYMVIAGADVTKYTDSAAASVFGIKPITGSTGAATATIDVIGFLA